MFHYHKKETEETNILFFPFQCSTSLIISCLLIISLAGIPIFIAYAAFAAKQKILPHYPPIKTLMTRVGYTLIHTLPLLLFITYLLVTENPLDAITTTLLLLLLYTLPTQLLSNTFFASLKPAFQTTYFLRALISFALMTTLFFLAQLVAMLPVLGSILAYSSVVISTYYSTLFTLTLLAEEVMPDINNS